MADEDSQRKAQTEALIPLFQLDRVLNQDQMGRRIALLGRISEKPALMTVERAALLSDSEAVNKFLRRLTDVRNLQWNDIYHWYLSSLSPSVGADLKLNLIYPCDSKHIQKYSAQPVRMVTETSEIYHRYVRPYMSRYRDQGRLNWVFNILDGKTEQEDIILRHPPTTIPSPDSRTTRPEDEGFILLPDLNWDRHTVTSLHLLAIPTRHDLWSLRDLRPQHVRYLRTMRALILRAVPDLYKPAITPDQLKLYLHYQPTYYHLHIHVVHVQLEAGATQSVGKAWGLETVISLLELMETVVNGRNGGVIQQPPRTDEGGGDEYNRTPSEKSRERQRETDEMEMGMGMGMDSIDLTYYIGEASELYQKIFGPLKEGKDPIV